MVTQVQTRNQTETAGLLRHAILANGIFCGVSGIILLPAAAPLATLLGIPAPLCSPRNRLCTWLLRRSTLLSRRATAYQPETGACRHSAGCPLGNR